MLICICVLCCLASLAAGYTVYRLIDEITESQYRIGNKILKLSDEIRAIRIQMEGGEHNEDCS